MTHLEAFVGHSFLETDAPVVNRILIMLNCISQLMPGFKWDHAQAAEPKELSQKVKEKMKGKNLFIGICTPKEQVVETAMLRRCSWPFHDELVAAKDKFQAKTSDWILQEIGMAVGKDMQIVLLIESGVRKPGGLQGDLEYIEFDRSQPERSLDKLANMLRTLLPAAVPSGETHEPVSSAETQRTEDDDNWFLQFLIPNPSWSAETYTIRYRLAVEVGDEGADEIRDAFNGSVYGADPHARSAFEAAGISGTVVRHKGEWVAPLRELVKRFPNTPGPYASLGERFAEIGEHVVAAENYELAAQFTTVAAENVRLLTQAAEQYTKGDQLDRAGDHIARIGDLVVTDPSLEADAMVRLAGVWKSSGNDELFTACSERALEIEPDRAGPRFDLAHKYNEIGLAGHALHNYRQYLKVKNDPSAWNNLGVAAAASKLPVAAIEAYRFASDAGNSLATSNLADQFLEAGFLSEALKLCTEGLTKTEAHPRLFEAKARCDRSRAEETERESKILEETGLRRGMLRSIGHHSILKRAPTIADVWVGPECRLLASTVGSELTLTGTYIREVSPGLSDLLLGNSRQRERKYTVVYSGTFLGRAFIGRVKTTMDGTKPTSLLSADLGKECIGTINESSTRIDLLVENKERVTLRVFRELISTQPAAD